MPRKGENIYKRKDSRWEGRYIKSRSLEGKAIYGYIYAKTYREVRSKLHEKSCATPIAPDPIMSPDLFGTLAQEWLSNARLQTKESTANKYQNLLDSYILPFCKNQPLSEFSYVYIEDYCQKLLSSGGKRENGLSPKTVSDTLSVIRSVLKFAIKKGKTVPCDGSSIQIKQVQKGMRVLSKTEQETLCRYLYSEPNPYNIGILLCLFTGLRVGEICALRWEDISFEEQVIYVHKTLQRIQDKTHTGKKTRIVITTPKSTCSIRTIPIPDELLKTLNEIKTVSTGYVLTNSNDKFVEPRTMQNRFKTALEKAAIKPANFHALRHTFATRCIELGFDVKSLSEILGHATVNITMNRYVHPTLELKKENMQRLSSLFAVT